MCIIVVICFCLILSNVTLNVYTSYRFHTIERPFDSSFGDMGKAVNKKLLIHFPVHPYDVGTLCGMSATIPEYNTKDYLSKIDVQRAAYFKPYYYIEMYICDSLLYRNLKKEWSKRESTKLRDNDTSQYAVIHSITEDNQNEAKLELSKFLAGKGEIPPLPLFDVHRTYNIKDTISRNNNLVDTLTVSGLHPETDIYIISYGNQNMMSQKIDYPNYMCVGKSLGHGFSCGIAFYDAKYYVYYWTLVW